MKNAERGWADWAKVERLAAKTPVTPKPTTPVICPGIDFKNLMKHQE